MADPMTTLTSSMNLTGTGQAMESINNNFAARHGWDSASKTTAYTQVATDELILCDTSGAGFTVTLLAAASWANKCVRIMKTSSDGNTLTVDGSGAETINGTATVSKTAQYGGWLLFSTGTAVLILGTT